MNRKKVIVKKGGSRVVTVEEQKANADKAKGKGKKVTDDVKPKSKT